ncbi:alcohol dehydrogenase catalytic domain-containing protein [Sphingopyxis sp.]|uniref:alcohol dehydrogenase catalytic domain-containing protein n=1 Tax=Sphingopyxis sp. TaxID=1908224 RepID=UPI00344EC991
MLNESEISFHESRQEDAAMMRAAKLYETGAPEVICVETIELSQPGPHEVRLRQIAIGVNFIDVAVRRGLIALPLPSGLGVEAAGVIESVGSGVADFAVGDRVCYGFAVPGAYATHRNIEARSLVRLPDTIDFETAAAATAAGLTAGYLLLRHAARLRQAMRSWCMLPQVQSGSFWRDGPITSVPPSSVRSVRTRR